MPRLRRNDARGNAHRRRPCGHRFDDHGVAADLGAIAHLKAAQNLGTGAHHHVLAQRRVALGALVKRRAAQRHALVDRAAVADLGRLADDHTHCMIEEHAVADLRAGVDFDAGEPARHMRDEAPQPLEAMRPTPVRRSMQPDGMQARIACDHFPGTAGSRVALKNALDIGSQAVKHEK
ncbi:hypothetical protein SDC9_107438 [bioreactor metagenome]|uniref:Uncharacterized protein n=1 Tax=bioreactor metagenome TaxID=1076179 RepID=A0A645B6A1_9ZZZZ